MKDKLSIGLLVRVSFTKFNPIKSNKKMKAEYATAHGSDESMHSSTTRMIHKRFVDPIQKIETETRQLVERYTLPWEDRGNRLLPADCVHNLQMKLADTKRKWDTAVEAFCAEWQTIIDDARRRLNGDFNASNYPPVEHVRNRFNMQAVFMPMPDNSRLVDTIRDEMEQIFEDRICEASDDLRRRLIDKLHHLADRCAEVGNEGARFHKSSVQHVVDLCDLIPDMMIRDDDELLEAVAEARKLLEGIDSDVIKSSPELAKSIRRDADEIANSLL